MNHVKDVTLESSQKTVNGGHIQKMDGWIPMYTTEGRCSPSNYPLTNTDIVLIPGKPRCIDPSILNANQIMFLLCICAFTFTGVDWNLRCMILGTQVLVTRS